MHEDDDGYMEDEDEADNKQVEVHKPKLPGLFKDLGLGGVSTKDKFKIAYSDGTLSVTVKRPSGVTQTVTRNVEAGFRALTEFDPVEMKNKAERNKHIHKAAKKGMSQQQIADQFGLSQSMVNKIINSK
jgi:hypothetical protein